MAAPQLLERDAELAALASAVDAAARGGGGLTAIVGAAGLGKTRLLAEAVGAATAAGFDVYTGRGSELEEDIAFGLVRQLYEPHLVRAAPDERARLLKGAAGKGAAAVLSDAGDYGEAPGDYAILHGLFWLTANLCEARPIALVLDDLHWADAASLRFLAYLLPRLGALPVAVLVALRPGEHNAPQHLLNQIVTDPGCTVLRPAPLTKEASGHLVRGVLAGAGEQAFLNACHSATQGNPLLLHDLAVTIKAEGLVPTAASLAMVDVLGPRAVSRRVSLWMNRLPPAATALAQAVSVLGDGASLQNAADLARLSHEDALRAAQDLERADLFRTEVDGDHAVGLHRVRFGHPVVRATLYEGMDPADRVDAHRRAAALLRDRRERAEHVATHLLRVPPANDAGVVEVLRKAAEEALAHGSPDSAATYLRRCLAEPPPVAIRADVQWELGKIMTLVDTARAADDLRVALALATTAGRRAQVAVLLSTALIYLLRFDEAEQVCLDALADLPPGDAAQRGPLEANLLLIPILQPNRQDLAERRHAALAMSGHPSPGGGALDCLLAAHRSWRCDPGGVELALQGLNSGVVDQVYPETIAMPVGWIVLIHADRDEAITTIDAVVARAHQNGSVNTIATAHVLRGLAWLWRGQLVEAEADIQAGIQSADAARVELATLLAQCFLADTLMERGRLDEAEAALDSLGLPDPVPHFGPMFWYLDSRARLLRRRGQVAEAYAMALATGERLAMHDAQRVPSFSSWRLEAALCAHALGRGRQAVELADEDLELARQWGAPRALGRALRVAGQVRRGPAGLALLQEAVEVLEGSPARIEYARSLVELGSALRRAGSRVSARRPLIDGLAIAEAAGAVPLVEQARAELRAAGARPRSPVAAGPAALTPSERRVAELAAAGNTNRNIAEQLFITVKTVEVHLTSAYRKVGIRHRDQLATALNGGGAEG
ncbi:helix-turn-helix transcriptional regulator [Labedaea rhizosphaerae]|uniref:Regulatory LuxR family protein n=1 Tax=Labedaea rhizosphaerae TaxID=598644 RepID=A0A4V3CZR3_LABRH|nr:LuxR family transcriptional regulator [Labedaea rhizosphaerae]TDQ00781.1 regulatory LuxR family protein [Labedaea rhizosphaerae]